MKQKWLKAWLITQNVKPEQEDNGRFDCIEYNPSTEHILRRELKKHNYRVRQLGKSADSAGTALVHNNTETCSQQE